jgi:hypothetical protein
MRRLNLPPMVRLYSRVLPLPRRKPKQQLSDRLQKWKRQRVAVSTRYRLLTRPPAVRSIGQFLATHLVFESIRK